MTHTAPAADELWTVAELTAAVKEAVEANFPPCWVRGEIREFRAYASGHWYFSLCDTSAQVRCVMWKGNVGRQKPPAEGTDVFIFAAPGIYEQKGEFRLVVSKLLATSDVGLMQQQRERVRAALATDGLLDPARKRALPTLPTRIAVVTSLDGAALRDIVRVAGARWPLATLYVIGSRVQGETAPAELARALALVNRIDGVELCLLGRGGGSKDDLAAFDDERVCRALAAVQVPTISAVGHETDISLCDLVADVRAATPSNAVELALPDRDDLLHRVDHLGARLAGALVRRTSVASERVERAADRLESAVTRRLVADGVRLERAAHRLSALLARRVAADRTRLDRAGDRLGSLMERHLLGGRAQLERAAAQLDALSPLRVLQRGYAIPRGPDGRVWRSRADFVPSTPFTLRVADGDVAARVEPA